MAGPARAATHLACYAADPQIADCAGGSWVIRAANFVVTVSEMAPGDRFERRGEADEHMILTTPGLGVRIEAGTDVDVAEPTLAIVPPGDSVVTCTRSGRLIRVFTSGAADLAAQASNAAAYDPVVDDVAPLTVSPPPGGYRLRAYRLSDYETETQDKPFMLFRSAGLMANVFKPFVRPRDTTRLSPHHHDDFEQCSLALSGVFVHRLRYPWSPDLADWREDEELVLDSPSLLIIPPKVIHTTYVTSPDGGWLIDIFAPARADFTSKPGLVLNADDYPAIPETAA